MIEKKIIEVETRTCDRCRDEIDMEQFWNVNSNRLQVSKTFDLCDRCYSEFRKWMRVLADISTEVKEPVVKKEAVVDVLELVGAEQRRQDKAEKEAKERERALDPRAEMRNTDFMNSIWTKTDGQKLKAYLAKVGLSQKEFADKIGLSHQAVSTLVCGKYDNLRQDTRSKLYAYFNY